jgi:tetratricopeptide (TPR) repeat protein
MIRDSVLKEPRNSRLQYSMGMVYVKARNFDKAAEHFRAALLSYPCNPTYHIALGKALVDKGDLLGAAREYESIPPGKGVNELLDENKRALYRLLAADYEKKLQARPDDSGLLFALGVFYAKTSENQKALLAFQKSWDLDQTRYDALYNIISISMVLDEKDRARDAYRKLVTLAPADNPYRKEAEKLPAP